MRERSYFAVVGSFDTAAGAVMHLRDLQRARFGLKGAVFPPRRGGRHWVVVAASFATLKEAEDTVRWFRRTTLQPDAYVWSPWRARRGIDGRVSFVPLPISVTPVVFPPLFAPPSNDEDARFFVKIDSGTTIEEADAKAKDLRNRCPGLPVVVFPPAPLAGANPNLRPILIAARVKREEAEKAKLLVRNLGLVEDAEIVELTTAVAKSWLPDDPELVHKAREVRRSIYACVGRGNVTVESMSKCVNGWVTPQAYAACTDLVDDSVPDAGTLVNAAAMVSCSIAPLAQPPVELLQGTTLSPEKLKQILQVGQQDITFNGLTAAALTTCATNAGNDKMKLLSCAAETFDHGKQDKALACVTKSAEEAAVCLAKLSDDQSGEAIDCWLKKSGKGENPYACLAENNAADLKKAESAERCVVGAQGDRDFDRNCLSQLIKSKRDRNAIACLKTSAGDKGLDCLVEGDKELTRVREVTSCLTAARRNPSKIAACTRGAGIENGPLAAAAACTRVEGKELALCLSKTHIAGDFAKGIAAAKCISDQTEDGKASLACVKQLLPAGQAARAVRCTGKSGSEQTACLAKAIGGDAEKIADGIEMVRCAQKQGRNEELIGCMKGAFGDDKKAVAAACFAAGHDPSECLATADERLAKAKQIYDCAKGVGDAATMLETCGAGMGDEKTRRTAACMLRAGGERCSVHAFAWTATYVTI